MTELNTGIKTLELSKTWCEENIDEPALAIEVVKRVNALYDQEPIAEENKLQAEVLRGENMCLVGANESLKDMGRDKDLALAFYQIFTNQKYLQTQTNIRENSTEYFEKFRSVSNDILVLVKHVKNDQYKLLVRPDERYDFAYDMTLSKFEEDIEEGYEVNSTKVNITDNLVRILHNLIPGEIPFY